MCLHGVYKWVNIINPEQVNEKVKVDACIAEEIQALNNKGVITLGSCCGHGLAGQIIEWENGYGKWKGHLDPPHALIKEESIQLAEDLGYKPYPYYYADGKNNGVWQLNLKSGCVTKNDCKEWHSQNTIPYMNNIGVIST